MSRIYNNKEAATRYNTARAFPEETARLWMDVLAELVPRQTVSKILDLGGGTGRFSGSLQKRYSCPVITIDPSAEMLRQGIKGGLRYVSWIHGVAENIPLAFGSIDLVWMSNVFHHLVSPQTSFKEINRILSPDGRLILRNGTVETDEEIAWGKCFPEAAEFDIGRIPRRSEIIGSVIRCGFDLIEYRTVYQLFASSYREYYDKISMRGLSSLIAISDEAFNAGLARLREWVSSQPDNKPVYEPIDIFSFRKNR